MHPGNAESNLGTTFGPTSAPPFAPIRHHLLPNFEQTLRRTSKVFGHQFLDHKVPPREKPRYKNARGALYGPQISIKTFRKLGPNFWKLAPKLFQKLRQNFFKSCAKKCTRQLPPGHLGAPIRGWNFGVFFYRKKIWRKIFKRIEKKLVPRFGC